MKLFYCFRNFRRNIITAYFLFIYSGSYPRLIECFISLSLFFIFCFPRVFIYFSPSDICIFINTFSHFDFPSLSPFHFRIHFYISKLISYVRILPSSWLFIFLFHSFPSPFRCLYFLIAIFPSIFCLLCHFLITGSLFKLLLLCSYLSISLSSSFHFLSFI